jgi:hypothetical protein
MVRYCITVTIVVILVLVCFSYTYLLLWESVGQSLLAVWTWGDVA